MSRNSSVYFILWILLQVLLLVKVNCQPTPFKPRVYSCHTATFIDNKLYILGGLDLNSKMLNEFFYLDVSVPFNTQELSWQDLSNINMVSDHFLATSVKGGTKNDTLFLYGAFQSETLVYTFNSRSLVWSTPTISGKVDMLPSVQTVTDPSSREDVIFEQELINVRRGKKYGLTGVIDYNGKFYLWGGATSNITLINDMLVLDTINLNWDGGSLINKLLISDTNYTVWMSWYGPDHVPNVPTPRRDYSATLIPNNKIIYLGGIGDIVSFEIITKGTTYNLSEVYIYDTINNSWDTKITSGNIPSDRGAFSTILGLDGQRIIIFGGFYDYPGYLDTTLYVLDLNNFNWYIPKISGKIPKPRAYHKANVIGKYMIVSFGEGYDKLIESDILLLDISNNEEYIWTTIFDPKIPSPPSPSPSPSPSLSLSPSPSSPSSLNNSGNIAGAVVGSLLSGILLSNKNKRKQKTIHKNENDNDYSREEKELPIIREIMRTLQNENTTSNHEPEISPSAVVNTNNDNHGQEVISSLKDEIIQAIKQEIGQNLKNEILQAVEENFNITKNNA
ncbi:galactose oxidase [Rhizophagus irregularis]|uniref:Galactose oxidase n=1 Tax=Rhizophagus irregularis TaxID=588596 RepID=A0A2I1H7Y6_9GLOM|nr:galactose oxidase [Rhizophagus irregularis]